MAGGAGGWRWLERGWLGGWLRARVGGWIGWREGGWLEGGSRVARGWSIGSIRGHRISDTNGSVGDALIKVLLKQP